MSSRKSYKQAYLARAKKESVEERKEEHIPSILSLQPHADVAKNNNHNELSKHPEVQVIAEEHIPSILSLQSHADVAKNNNENELSKHSEIQESVKVVIEDKNEDDKDHVKHPENLNIIPQSIVSEHRPAYYSHIQHASSSSSAPHSNIKAREDALEEKISKTFGIVLSNEELLVLLREANELNTPRSKDLGNLAKEIQVSLRNSVIDQRSAQIFQSRNDRFQQMKKEGSGLLPVALLAPLPPDDDNSDDEEKELKFSINDRMLKIGLAIAQGLKTLSTPLLRIDFCGDNAEFPMPLNFYFLESKQPIKVLLDVAGSAHPNGLNVAIITMRSLGVKPAIIFTEILSGCLELTSVTLVKCVFGILAGFVSLPELSE